ncbi:MAG: hypothetical protein AMK72_14635 [Planctomycetes bacterium SM23_25]|nr:MAG: hypothetical protein AMK72_14635 [Planctomycetes bacterium SM23_25]
MAGRVAGPLPVLAARRWQTLATHGVCIDARGRPWILRSDPKRSEIYCLDGNGEFAVLSRNGPAPEWVMADRAGRFWFATARGLYWRHPASGQVQHRPPGDESLRKHVRNLSGDPCFRGAMEHSTGRLYFADPAGVHVFDRGRWSYQAMKHPAPKNASALSGAAVCMVEGQDGRTVVWAQGDYFGGFWVHDGKTWTQFSSADDGRLRKLQAVIPLRGDWVLIGTRYEPAFLLDLRALWPLPTAEKMLAALTKLGDKAPNVRAEAEKAMLAMGPRARKKLSRLAGFIADQRVRIMAQGVIAKMPGWAPAPAPAAPDSRMRHVRFLYRSSTGETLIAHGVFERTLAVVRPDGTILSASRGIPKPVQDFSQQTSLGRTASAVPLRDGSVMVCTNPFTVWDGKAFRTALDRPFEPGGWRIHGQDAQGRIYLQRYWRKILVFDGRYEDRRPHLPHKCFPAARGTSRRSTALDSKGRLWTRLDPRKYPFLSCYSQGRWTHLGDPGPPSILYETVQRDGGKRTVRWEYKHGKWAQSQVPPGEWPAKHEETPVDRDLVYRPGQWYPRAGITPTPRGFSYRRDPGKRLPAMTNPLYLQPLKDGGMVAADSSGRAYFFNGREWSVYRNLPELVRARRAVLAKRIDNERGMALGLDATGRIWTGMKLQQAGGGFAVEAGQWAQVPEEYRRFTRDGRRCLTTRGLLDTTVYPPLALAKFRDGVSGSGIARAIFDSQGRQWFRALRSWRIEKDRLFRVPDDSPGYTAIFADSSGRVWFVGPREGFGRGELQLLCPGGRWLTVKAPGLWVGRILEQTKDTFWSLRGWRFSRLRITGEPGREKVTLDREYTGCVPGIVAWAAIDAEGALWVLSPDREGLIRYELPRP